MNADPELRRYKSRRDRLYRRLTANGSQIDALLASLQENLPTSSDAVRLEALGKERATLLQDYLEQAATITEYIVRLQDENRRSKMTTQRTKAPRSQAKIEELSQELTTNLRLERVDDAIKALLDFLADSEFFTANATTGRRRKLRTLQNALAKALN
jgi:hypothetical protein